MLSIKKISLLLILLVSFTVGYGQFLNTTPSGSATTLLNSRGGYLPDSALILSKQIFADTTAANFSVVSKYSGALIQVAGNQLWFRTLNPNQWNRLNTSAASLVSISQGYGILASPNPITTTGTITTDTVLIVSKTYFNNIAVKYSDTSSMLANLLRKSDTAQMLSGYARTGNVVPNTRTVTAVSPITGGGSLGANISIGADTGRGNTQLVTGGDLNKVKDSLSGTINLQTVTNNGNTTTNPIVSNIGTSAGGNIAYDIRVGGAARSSIGLVGADGINSGSNPFWYTYLDDGTPLTLLRGDRGTGNLSTGGSLTLGSIPASATPATFFLTGESGTVKSRTNAQVVSDLAVLKISDTASMLSGYAKSGNVVPNTRTITAQSPITGGGSLGANIFIGADTGRGNTQLATGFDLNKIKDSIQTNVNGKLSISDTAAMLAPYLRNSDTAQLIAGITLDEVLRNGNVSKRSMSAGQYIGTDTTDAGRAGDGVFQVKRRLTSEINSNGHAFRDSTAFARPNRAYNSFDVISRLDSNITYDHLSGFQYRPQIFLGSSGLLTNSYGFLSFPAVYSGTVDSMFHFSTKFSVNQGGRVNTEYAVFIPKMQIGATKKAIYVRGDSCYFGENIYTTSIDAHGVITSFDLDNYAANYGSSFTNRTKVDKGYVDSVKSTITSSPFTQTGTGPITTVIANSSLTITGTLSSGGLSVIGSSIPVFIDGNGITIGGGAASTNQQIRLTKNYNTTATVSGIGGGPSIGSTSSAVSTSNFGINMAPNIGSFNTQNYTRANGALYGFQFTPTIASNVNTYTVSTIVGGTVGIVNGSSNTTVSNGIGFLVSPFSATGPITNSTYIQTGSATPVSGNWAMYHNTSFNNYFGTGSNLFNTTTAPANTNEKITVVGSGSIDSLRSISVAISSTATIGGNLTVTGGIAKPSGGSSSNYWATDGSIGTISAGGLSPFTGTSSISTTTVGATLNMGGDIIVNGLGKVITDTSTATPGYKTTMSPSSFVSSLNYYTQSTSMNPSGVVFGMNNLATNTLSSRNIVGNHTIYLQNKDYTVADSLDVAAIVATKSFTGTSSITTTSAGASLSLSGILNATAGGTFSNLTTSGYYYATGTGTGTGYVYPNWKMVQTGTNSWSLINGSNINILTSDQNGNLTLGGNSGTFSAGRIDMSNTASTGPSIKARTSSPGNYNWQGVNTGNTLTTSSITEDGNLSVIGTINFTTLSGVGSRAVLADANGFLSAPVSDSSVKENITPIKYGIKTIMKLTPVWGEYKKGWKNYGEGRQNFLIAQNVQKYIPEAVFKTPSTGKLGINKDQMDAVYVQAFQDLQHEIDDLKAEIRKLKKKK